jgi:hypothetical protein
MPTLLHLTPHDHGRPLTLDELERSSAQEGYHFELIDGKPDFILLLDPRR